MFKYFFKRMTLMALIMIIVSSITFFIVRWLPGDPVFLWVGDHPTKEQIDQARSYLGLNQPLHKQYLSFLKKTVSLDLGVSLRTKQPVSKELASRFSATFELVFFFNANSYPLGFPNGINIGLKTENIYGLCF